ncbi:hypothetical protein J1N35_042294 [Gossypium stocksii]|uniref:TF-B3 domain-containing protein n=1 Tax=Gossypium stocksii TaxID=47602 RepID=A0A9D3UH20_9ROSI|nr:hypothetical protein J1N35_042294 [Gossypium stocksii]
MAKEKQLLMKRLSRTDIKVRLSIPTKKNRCFLNFRNGHKVEFKVKDDNGKDWVFCCSIRKKKGYRKPVLSKGWLPFVRCWKLEIGDEVRVYRKMGRYRKGYYRIEVIKRRDSPLVQNHDAEEPSALAVASNGDVEEEATVASNSSTLNHEQTEGLQNQPGLMFEFISLKPDITISEPPSILALHNNVSEPPCILALHSNVEMPVTSSRAPYFKFL